ncbi:peptide deformylase [Quadrisphaera sp. DSM 44207]|uniref:peptide deformylase n=1 Tax=Quadrisphaera sp. DSM 44207 TaxID=1881057 RepID=UPI000887178A|nr:peptide deformylase [Quadrisphaera sp. DSM 44207]SDQ48891.1 peptide deformylase [Quadrisphaera sp. DSM 44207]
MSAPGGPAPEHGPVVSSRELRRRVGQLLRGPRPLPIVQAGDPVLRRVAQPYDGELSPELLGDLVAALRATMHAAPGVGLAAPQVGLGLALAVVEDERGDDDDPRERYELPFRVLVNPRYEVQGEQRVAFPEGCLSVRGYEAVVARPRSIRLTGQDETGRALDEVLTGWPARIVQHETDHLNGALYLDRADLRTLTATGTVS